jgi:hypothetical protein
MVRWAYLISTSAEGCAALRDYPIDVPADVLRFAPKKLRRRHRTEDRIESGLLEAATKSHNPPRGPSLGRLACVSNYRS